MLDSPIDSSGLAITRRRLLGATTLPLVLPLTGNFDSSADAAEPNATSGPLNRFPRMVHEYFVNQVRLAQQRNQQTFASVKTAEDARKHVDRLRAKIRDCFGPEPERTPLNPRITGTIERDTYRIEKLIFDSRPGFPVTANLYVPTNRDLPLPGVVGTCGHSLNGKAAEAYQAFAQGLARQGYVCLIYDPIGQGERSQYVNEQLKPQLRGTVAEHLHAGNQQFLVGEFLGMWRAWDGIRALDYLLTRKEVDPKHIGVTGNSGGGTMTTWLCGLESRWTMAAPACFVTTFLRNMENELPADTEQCPPKALALGLDHADFLAAMAPKPVVVLAKERDFFDVRGSEEAYARLKNLYELFDAPEKVSLFAGPTEHGYTQENREAMYRWFNGITGISDSESEPQLTIEPDETLWCTPKGQVAELDAKTVFDFTRQRSIELGKTRGEVNGESLIDAVHHVLKIPRERSAGPDYRILRSISSRGYPTKSSANYAVETEPEIFSIVTMLTSQQWLSRPPRDGRTATLYVAHRSSDAELREEPMIKELIEAAPERRFFACDVRGIGESLPNTCGMNSFDDAYGCDYFYAIHSLMLDRPYLGQKTFDVLRVLDWLNNHGYDDVHLVGKGWGALAATFAALLSEHVTQVTLKNSLVSYSAVAQQEHYDWPLATLLPNVLERFDLPDCYRVLQTKKLKQIEPAFA